MAVWEAVKPPIRYTYRVAARFGLALARPRYRYVFVLAHMRSGSTLLAHILANNPEITGAGEMHLNYNIDSDLQNLVIRTCEHLRKPFLVRRYIVDQVNHDYIKDDVLSSKHIHRGIILIRKPIESVKSIMTLLNWKESQAAEYYINRIERLARYGSCLARRGLLVEYSDLVEHTQMSLSALSMFLDLRIPLSPNYSVHRATYRSGDPSEYLRMGRIVHPPGYQVTLSEEIVTATTQAFDTCRKQLRGTIAQLTDFIPNT